MDLHERHDSKLRVNMRLSILEGIFAMPICFLAMPGNFLLASLVTDALGFAESVYGVVASLPAWSNVIQLFALPWMARFATTKAICLAFSWAHVAAWVAVGIVLPKIARDGPWHSPGLILGLCGAGAVAFALVNVSWTSWVQEWLPTRSRGKYLGRRNRLLQISTVAFLLLASQLLAYWKDDAVFGFQIIVFGSAALRAVSIVLQQWILPTKATLDERRASPLSQFAAIARNKPLMRFVMFGAAFGFSANFMGPFFPVFFYKALGMSVESVGQLVIVATVTGALSMPGWGEILDKYGCRPGLLIALGIWMGIGYLYFLVTPERTWLLYLIWGVGGVAGAGFLFGSFNMILKLIPPDAKTTAISFNLAASSLAAACAPILGGLVFEWSERTFTDRLAIFHVLAFFHHTATLLTGAILFTVAEPKASSLSQAVGAMRSLRQLATLFGVSFFANYMFIKKGAHDKKIGR